MVFNFNIYMKHLLPTTDIQSIKIIPRVYSTSVSMDLRDDSTNTTVSITLVFVFFSSISSKMIISSVLIIGVLKTMVPGLTKKTMDHMI